MKIKTILLSFFLFFLLACETERVSELEDQIKQLQEKINNTTDPATIAELQSEIVRLQQEVEKPVMEKVQEKVKGKADKLSELREQLELTGDRKSCEKITGEIRQLEKDIIEVYRENGITEGFGFAEIRACTDVGYEDG